MWRYRGTPHYLGDQARRLGITQVLADRARNNAEIYRVSVLLSQLCERYHKARKEDGKPAFPCTEIGQIRGTLQQCEQECAKLHALAAASAAMLDDAWAAFELSGGDRHFAVLCDYDPIDRHPTLPSPSQGEGSVPGPVLRNGDGTVGLGLLASTKD